jgi:hypothetical protein
MLQRIRRGFQVGKEERAPEVEPELLFDAEFVPRVSIDRNASTIPVNDGNVDSDRTRLGETHRPVDCLFDTITFVRQARYPSSCTQGTVFELARSEGVAVSTREGNTNENTAHAVGGVCRFECPLERRTDSVRFTTFHIDTIDGKRCAALGQGAHLARGSLVGVSRRRNNTSACWTIARTIGVSVHHRHGRPGLKSPKDEPELENNRDHCYRLGFDWMSMSQCRWFKFNG